MWHKQAKLCQLWQAAATLLRSSAFAPAQSGPDKADL
jgi:hypothetical protein